MGTIAIEKVSRRRAGSATSGIREKKDPAFRPPAFPIVPTDREPGKGYFLREHFPLKDMNDK